MGSLIGEFKVSLIRSRSTTLVNEYAQVTDYLRYIKIYKKKRSLTVTLEIAKVSEQKRTFILMALELTYLNR